MKDDDIINELRDLINLEGIKKINRYLSLDGADTIYILLRNGSVININIRQNVFDEDIKDIFEVV